MPGDFQVDADAVSAKAVDDAINNAQLKGS